MEYIVGDKIFLEMKVDGELLFEGTYECTNRFPEFTKEDLKPGMVVELRNGKLYMIMPDADDELFLISENGYYPNMKKDFDSSLRYTPCALLGIGEQSDIVRVYSCISKQDGYLMSLNVGKEDRKILWERKEPRKMTISETKKIFKELTGEEIEIVERIRKDRIVIGENTFTDINKAIGYLKRLRCLKQFDAE